MGMEEFAQLVLNETTRLLAEKGMDCTATLTSVVKSNDLVKSGVCIRRKDSGMGPNLYLDKIYPRFEAGEPISDLVEELIDVFLQSEHDAQPDAEDFDLSFDKIKDSLRVRVVDTQANRKYLQTVVHLEVPGTGLAYVPEMRMDKDGGFWSAVITKAMADANGYDHNDVMILAVNNTVKCDPPKLMYLNSAIFNYEDKDSNLLGKDEPINSEPLVLTSESTEFGAYAMLQKPVLDFIAEKAYRSVKPGGVILFSISNGYIDVSNGAYTPIKGVYNPENNACNESETALNLGWMKESMLLHGCKEVSVVDAESEILLISKK